MSPQSGSGSRRLHHDLDRRQGRWTFIEESPSYVAVRYTIARRAKLARDCGVFLAILAFFSLMAGPAAREFMLTISILCLSAIGCSTWGHIRYRRRPLLVVVDDSRAPAPLASHGVLHRKEIEAVELAENVSRDRSEDFPLLQVYLHVRDEQYAILVYQQRPTRAGRLRATRLARRLARRWGVHLLRPRNA